MCIRDSAGTDAETQTITVEVTGDTVVEADETFTVLLSGITNSDVTATDASGLGTIENDDAATIAINDVTQVETDAGTTDFVFTVTLTGDVAGGFDATYNINDGTAVDASDYTDDTGTITFAGTDAETQTITVSVTGCLLYTSPSPRDATLSRMPSSA